MTYFVKSPNTWFCAGRSERRLHGPKRFCGGHLRGAHRGVHSYQSADQQRRAETSDEGIPWDGDRPSSRERVGEGDVGSEDHPTRDPARDARLRGVAPGNPRQAGGVVLS